jgi:hypothetical protein
MLLEETSEVLRVKPGGLFKGSEDGGGNSIIA